MRQYQQRPAFAAPQAVACPQALARSPARLAATIGNRAFVRLLQRYSGEPGQTRDELLRWVWATYLNVQVDPRLIDEEYRKAVENQIYDKATKGSTVHFTQRPTDAQHRDALQRAMTRTDDNREVVTAEEDTWLFYERGYRRRDQRTVRKRRVAVHIVPDRIYDMISYLCRFMLAQDFVDSFKVSLRPESVDARLDNIDIYFHDTIDPPSDNAETIAALLFRRNEWVAPDHPAMMSEFLPGWGVGTGDDPSGGESFTGLRSRVISAAVVDHVSGNARCGSYDDFARQVNNRLHDENVDWQNPSRTRPPDRQPPPQAAMALH